MRKTSLDLKFITHVLISDPTAGYGIFIQKMLASAE